MTELVAPRSCTGRNSHLKKCTAPALNGAGLGGDARRTAIRNLVRAGVLQRVAMQLTGHKTRAIFERYNITSPNDLRDAARRLECICGRWVMTQPTIVLELAKRQIDS